MLEAPELKSLQLNRVIARWEEPEEPKMVALSLRKAGAKRFRRLLPVAGGYSGQRNSKRASAKPRRDYSKIEGTINNKLAKQSRAMINIQTSN
jgi:hypothetical protein